MSDEEPMELGWVVCVTVRGVGYGYPHLSWSVACGGIEMCMFFPTISSLVVRQRSSNPGVTQKAYFTPVLLFGVLASYYTPPPPPKLVRIIIVRLIELVKAFRASRGSPCQLVRAHTV